MNHEINESKHLNDKELEVLKDSLQMVDRNALIFRLLLETGARSQELMNVMVSDVDLEKKTILIRGLKGSKDRRLPIKADTFEQLSIYIGRSNPEAYLFDLSTSRLRQLWYGFRPHGCKKSLHSLRHTFAINLIRAGKSVSVVKLALGHRDIKTTMIYADYVYTAKELAAIWDEAV